MLADIRYPQTYSELVKTVGETTFTGYQGVTCHHCGATHNVYCNITCIICERCGEFIQLSWCGNYEFCHKEPDYGWRWVVINHVIRKFGWYREYLN